LRKYFNFFRQHTSRIAQCRRNDIEDSAGDGWVQTRNNRIGWEDDTNYPSRSQIEKREIGNIAQKYHCFGIKRSSRPL